METIIAAVHNKFIPMTTEFLLMSQKSKSTQGIE